MKGTAIHLVVKSKRTHKTLSYWPHEWTWGLILNIMSEVSF